MLNILLILLFVALVISICCSISVVIIVTRIRDDIFKEWLRAINLNSEVISLNKQILEHNREIIDNYVSKEEEQCLKSKNS